MGDFSFDHEKQTEQADFFSIGLYLMTVFPVLPIGKFLTQWFLRVLDYPSLVGCWDYNFVN